MAFFNRIKAVWEKIGLVQRALLVAIVTACAIVGGLLVHWARRPDMRVLYQELAPEEAAQITEILGEKAIAYELRNGGTSIYVPKQNVYQLRLDMAKEGLPSGDQGGYKIFDNEKIGISPFVQGVNLKRALQDELAKSIQMIDGVEHARVHIVRSEQTLLASETGKTTKREAYTTMTGSVTVVTASKPRAPVNVISCTRMPAHVSVPRRGRSCTMVLRLI